MSVQSSGRRSFLIRGLLLAVTVLLGKGRNLFAKDDEIGKKMVKMSDPLPAALKYTPDASKVPKTLRKSEDMLCRTCVQYSKKTNYKGEEVGTCMLFQMGYVEANGWCMSWSKKT